MSRPSAALLFLACGVTFLALPGESLAQDNHYWTLQYGNQARLLGGAVIGSSSDLSSVYYNPGRLALSDRPEFVIAGNVFEFSSTSLRGTNSKANNEAGKTRFQLSPSLFAGELRFGFLGNGRMAYSFLQRHDSDLRLRAAFGDTATLPGQDFENNSTRIDHKLSEYWTGVSYANRIGDRIGIGVTMFITSRSHRTESGVELTSVQGGVPSYQTIVAGYDYYHWGVLWKVGAGTRFRDWDLGITLTTPRVKLLGKGDRHLQGLRIGPDAGGSELVAVQTLTGIKSTYKSPWSVAVGGSRRWNRNRIHLGLEWFLPLDVYTVLDAKPTAAAVGPPYVYQTAVRHASKGIVNAAIGFERRQNDNLRLYGSLHTDVAATEDQDVTTNLAFTTWNLWHLGAGASVRMGETDFTLGAIYAFGHSSGIVGVTDGIESTYRKLTIIVGFNFPFGDSPTPS